MATIPRRNYFSFWQKPLVRYILIRIFNAFVTLFFIITAVFLLMRLLPKERYINYDIVNKLPHEARESYINFKLDEYGLNDPVFVQLFRYYRDLIPFIPKTICVEDTYDENFNVTCVKEATVYFNLGQSITYKNGLYVTELIKERFPLSFMLSIGSLIVTYLIAYPLGVSMAKNKGKTADKLGNSYIVLTNAVPTLIFYYIWVIVGMKVFNLPSIFEREDFSSWIMPIWAIAFISIAGTSMWVRRYMVDEINSDYVKFARSKGLTEQEIMYKHVLRNAIVPLIRTFPAALIFAVVGSYFVEMLWAIPGSGSLLISALNKGDTPLVLGLTFVYASMSMAASLLGDITTVFFDPRISLIKNK